MNRVYLSRESRVNGIVQITHYETATYGTPKAQLIFRDIKTMYHCTISARDIRRNFFFSYYTINAHISRVQKLESITEWPTPCDVYELPDSCLRDILEELCTTKTPDIVLLPTSEMSLHRWHVLPLSFIE